MYWLKPYIPSITIEYSNPQYAICSNHHKGDHKFKERNLYIQTHDREQRISHLSLANFSTQPQRIMRLTSLLWFELWLRRRKPFLLICFSMKVMTPASNQTSCAPPAVVEMLESTLPELELSIALECQNPFLTCIRRRVVLGDIHTHLLLTTNTSFASQSRIWFISLVNQWILRRLFSMTIIKKEKWIVCSQWQKYSHLINAWLFTLNPY